MNPHNPNDPHDPHTSLIDSPHDIGRHQGRNGLHAGVNGRHTEATPGDDELDALADLFLGPTEHAPPTHAHPEHPHPASNLHEPLAPTPPATEPTRQLSIEGVVLGHLPVSASAWPGQYARTRAEQLGAPVAMVRLSLGSLSIDLFGVEPPEHPLPTETDAIEAVRALAATAILRVDEPAEAQLPSLPAVDRLCLLTGADDAAVVACYRKLKGVAAAAEAIGLPLPAVHLTIMGGDKAKAALAHQRIAGAAQAFLDADLLDPVIISRIGPTGSTTIYRGPTDLSLEALCDLLTLPQPKVAEPTREELSRSAPSPPQPESSTPTPTTPTTPEPEPVTATHHEPRSAPTAAKAPTPKAPDSERLSALVAGLTPLDSHCPLTDRVELAVDEEGHLHLLAAVLTSCPERSSADPLRDLLRVAAWARLNAEMLSRVEPKLATQTTQPGVHMVTDRACLATPLLETAIRVHLAIPARPAAFGLVAAPLDS